MSEKSTLEKVIKQRYSYRSKAVASIAVCALGGFCMYVTEGETGIGWALFGMLLIWGN